jgi:hypothetical protein
VEAILVAVLVLTAVLFFTSVQRPTGGGESRGLDLGPVASDTLGILQRRTFTTEATGDPEGWVTKVLAGDAATSTQVDDFVTQVLPTGAKHVLRLSNGIGTVGLLPTASPGGPQGARAAEVPLFPHWRAFASKEATDLAAPGQPLTSTNTILSRFTDPADSIVCIKAPYNATATTLWRTPVVRSATLASGSTAVTGISSTAALSLGMRVTGTGVPAGATVADVPSATSITLSAAATSSGASTLSFYANRVPVGAVYGTWAGYTNAGCTTGAVYAAVVLPGAKTLTGLTWTTTSKSLNAASAVFSASDVGKLVVGPGIPGGTYIAAYNSTTQVTLSVKPTVAGTNASCSLAANPSYPIYGLQLVVWFGA